MVFVYGFESWNEDLLGWKPAAACPMGDNISATASEDWLPSSATLHPTPRALHPLPLRRLRLLPRLPRRRPIPPRRVHRRRLDLRIPALLLIRSLFDLLILLLLLYRLLPARFLLLPTLLPVTKLRPLRLVRLLRLPPPLPLPAHGRLAHGSPMRFHLLAGSL